MMEPDRFGTSSRARERMLRELYEQNRKIVDPTVQARRNRRRYTGIAVLVLAVTAAIVAIVVAPESRTATSREGSALDRAILGADIPQLDTLEYDDSWLPAGDLAALAAGSEPLRELFDLQVRTIVIDAGHGGDDPGAIGPTGLREKEVTLDVALRVARRLQERWGYRALLTRSADSTLTLRDRVEFTNESGADLFVSVHVNAFEAGAVNVIETFYFGAQTSPEVRRMAELENRGADYSVADFNRMVSELGTTVKLQESRRLAVAIQRSLYNNVHSQSPQTASWGAKAAPFVVLLGAEVPAVLAEIGVVTNPQSERRLSDPTYREQLAVYLEEGILNYIISRARQGNGA